MKMKTAVLVFLSIFSGAGSAAVDRNVVISQLGAQGESVYFRVKGGFSESCQYGVVYIPATTTFGKFAFATLLTAKTMNDPVSRVVYTIDSETSMCVLTLVEATSEE